MTTLTYRRKGPWTIQLIFPTIRFVRNGGRWELFLGFSTRLRLRYDMVGLELLGFGIAIVK